MDITQSPKKARWLALSVVMLGIFYLIFCSDLFFLLDPFRTCSREDLSLPHSLTPAAAAGQRRVVHASAAYPLDQALGLSLSSCQLGSALRQVLIIRTCGPLTPGLRASYAKYAQELSASPHYDLWLLHDIGTDAPPPPPAAAADNGDVLAEYYDLQREYPGLGLFLYNTRDIKALLPTAAYIQKDKTPNYWFHDASLFLWSITCRPDLWRTPPLPPSRESELYMWTVEHDAIYFGDVATFLDEHSTNAADYIANYFPLRSNWSHWEHSTWRPPYNKALFKWQHVERHSTALLRYLYSITLLLGPSAVCALQPHWCVMAPLERRFIGPVYECSGVLTDDQVAEMWNDPAQQGKWNHAVLSRKSRGQCKSSFKSLKIPPPKETPTQNANANNTNHEK